MHTNKRFRQLLLMLAIMSLPSQLVLSKQRHHRKLIQEKPVFDSSFLPKQRQFQLTIKRTDYIYPRNPELFLHETPRVVRLNPTKDDNVLSGGVKENVPSSVINTREYGIKPHLFSDPIRLVPRLAPDLERELQAQLAQSKPKFAAEIAQQERLLQHQLQARQPKVPSIPAAPPQTGVPDLSKQFNLQLSRAEQQARKLIQPALSPQSAVLDLTKQVKLALDRANQQAQTQMPSAVPSPVENQEIAKQVKLSISSSAPKSMPEAPQIVGLANPAPDLSKQIEQRLAQSEQQKRTQLDTTSQQLQLQLALTKDHAGGTPPVTGTQSHTIPIQFPKIPPSSSPDVQAILAEKQMRSQMVAANLLIPPQTALDGKLLQATKRTDGAIALAKPQMDALITRLRLTPEVPSPPTPNNNSAAQDSTENIILWDNWHASFAKLAHDPLLKAIDKCTDPSGADTVSITVGRDHHLQLTLTNSSSNHAFDQAVLQAYNSLNGNPALEFPLGSKRTTVTFLIDNSHAAPSLPSEVRSETSIGDKEFQHLWKQSAK